MTRRVGLLIAILSMALVGCAAEPAAATPSVPTGPPTAATSAVPASSDVAAEPPSANLAAEGGDPVEGQLGTYVWRGRGSDSPRLPGSPITVGVAEPLEVQLDGGPAIGPWTVRARATEGGGPEQTIGQGVGVVRFPAPGVGTWSVAVQVTFGDGSGTATYFWELSVS